MARRKTARPRNVYLTPEPKWKELMLAESEEDREVAWNKCDYFCHFEVSDKKKKETVKPWLKQQTLFDKETTDLLLRVPETWLGLWAKHTYKWKKFGWMTKAVEAHILKRMPELCAKAEEYVEEQKEKKAEKPKITIQDRMREQCIELMGTWEYKIDCLVDGQDILKEFDPYNEMRAYNVAQIKPAHAKIIKEEFQTQYEEALEVQQWQDEELKEAYSNFDKKIRDNYVAFFEKIMTACDTLINTGKAQRKPRKPKVISREKLVAKLKYQINDSELGLASINPAEIIDATEVWVYNTKNRKLGVYYVDDFQQGLSVKGTTIQLFHESKSVQKTLRKPAEQLKEFKGTAKTKYQKAFDNIKTTDTKLNGRLNDSTIILKAF